MNPAPRLLLIASALLALAVPEFHVHAQWGGTLSLGNGYSSNIFGTSSPSAASLQSAELTLGYFEENGRWAAGYTGAFTGVPAFPDRQYTTHGLAATTMLPLDATDETRLSFFASVIARYGRDVYAQFDYQQALASAAFQMPVASLFSLRASYRVRAKEYPSYDVLGSVEHTAGIGANTSFETGTSIDIDAGIGYKKYAASSSVVTAGQSLLASNTGSSLTIEGGGPGGDGGGKGGGGNGNGGGNGDGTGNGSHVPDAGIPIVLGSTDAALQASVSLSLGQSLAENTGLSLRYRYRTPLSKQGSIFIAGWTEYGGDDDVADDPYSFAGHETSITLTQLLPWSMKAQATAYVRDKRYSYPMTLDPALAGPDRRDLRSGAGVRLEKSFDASWLFLDGFTLSLDYDFTRNQSNAAYFDYSAHSGGLSLDIGLGL